MRFPISRTLDRFAGVMLVGLVLCAAHAAATTVLQQSLSDLVKTAEIVFEGEVLSSTVVPGAPGKSPHTCFTFNVIDVIAGADPGGTLVLCFKGGEVDGLKTVVSDLNYPVVGEHGIYLAESTRQAMVNPLAGWDQGRFLITKDPVSGLEKMKTAQGRPVVAVAEDARHATVTVKVLSAGDVAGGVTVGTGPDLTNAISRDEFKAWLRSAR